MFAKTSALLLVAAAAGALTAHIPSVQSYGKVSLADRVHDADTRQFLITDITKPHIQSNFQANFFSNSCNDGFLGQVTGSGGASCVQSIPGTKGIALLSQPAGCTVTVYTDEVCSSGATLLVPGQCLQETETGIPSYSIDGNC